MATCCQYADVAGLRSFNETQGSIMSPDMFGLDELHSFRRSRKWAHVKAINLLWGETSQRGTVGTWRSWHGDEEGSRANEGTQDVHMHSLYSRVIKIDSVL